MLMVCSYVYDFVYVLQISMSVNWASMVVTETAWTQMAHTSAAVLLG